MIPNKRKIVNDPVYGFINIPSEHVFDLIEHPYFQRLRRIKQLGLTYYVYPGAIHSRFQHAMGAMHLMNSAIDVIRYKGCEITPEEAEAAITAALLHDIGHGPFSHTLEQSIVEGIDHETLSLLFMNKLNREFKNSLSLAIKLFKNEYRKKFLHQLVSSQLDMDRLDYLNRDSFFTGVSEGVIGFDRIIKMLNVVNDQLVIESKGIYSIEKFLIARRLMFWQVYFHKTALSAEKLLLNILKRAKYLASKRNNLFATPALHYFLDKKMNKKYFLHNENESLDYFSRLDDHDIITSVKVWCEHPDKVLSLLCKKLIYRHLFKIEIKNSPFNKIKIDSIKKNIRKQYKLSDNEATYFIFMGVISNHAYSSGDDRINILYNSGEMKDIAEASDMLSFSVLSKTIRKYFLCYPKECSINY